MTLFLIAGTVVAIFDYHQCKGVCIGYLIPILLFQAQNLILYWISNRQIVDQIETIIQDSKVNKTIHKPIDDKNSINNIADAPAIEIDNHDHHVSQQQQPNESETKIADKHTTIVNVNVNVSTPNSKFSNPNGGPNDDNMQSKSDLGDRRDDDTDSSDWNLIDKVKNGFGPKSANGWLKLELLFCVTLVLTVYVSGVIFAVQDFIDKSDLNDASTMNITNNYTGNGNEISLIASLHISMYTGCNDNFNNSI